MTHIETIDFNTKFIGAEVLPGLLHFSKHALFPEMLTRRLKRIGSLTEKYVSYKQWLAGFYVSRHEPCTYSDYLTSLT
ncbi:hypothetical protein HPB47_005532 [Ixodes persulcatus]|uniref:Uncharacterized protein n=1 Tax=Ixodes persulcatus TaxID=34615 RepID=A0AC60PCQ6_IXOPE|nr:hypothetical protein HPB47_005532 [Ixodes persulcatus]